MMDEHMGDDVREALRPIASLISKSEKAQQKVAPGTWQHTMLGDNLKALHLARGLIERGHDAADGLGRDDMQEALRALASMIARTEKAHATFAPGTSQHSLLRNRLSALRVAEAAVVAELEHRQHSSPDAGRGAPARERSHTDDRKASG
jgi:hypothetical protein